MHRRWPRGHARLPPRPAMDDNDHSDPTNDPLARAIAAANAGEPVRMLEELFATPVLDGLQRHLLKKWKFLRQDDHTARDIVADAVDALYAHVRKASSVRNVAAWLIKVSDRKAYEAHKQRQGEVPRDPGLLDGEPAKDRFVDAPDPGELRARALSVARSLLPQLGQQNVQRVMEYIFDAVEAGCEDLTNTEIAEALGLRANTVAKLKQRGFERLARAAKDSGAEIRLDVSHLGYEEEDAKSEV